MSPVCTFEPTPTEDSLARLIRTRICEECPRRTKFQRYRSVTPRACEGKCSVFEHLRELAHYADEVDPAAVSYDGAVQACILHERNRRLNHPQEPGLPLDGLIDHRRELAQLLREIARARAFLPHPKSL